MTDPNYDPRTGVYTCSWCGETSNEQYCVRCRWLEADALYILGDLRKEWSEDDCPHHCSQPCSPDCEFVCSHRLYEKLFEGRARIVVKLD